MTLKDFEDISVPGTPVKDSIFIASANIDTWVSGPAVRGYCERVCATYPCTDSQACSVSRTGTEDAPNPVPGVVSGTHSDDVTGEVPKRDTPEGPVHDPNGVTATPQVSTSIRKIPTPAIVGPTLSYRISDAQLKHSPLAMPSPPLSAISSARRSKGSSR